MKTGLIPWYRGKKNATGCHCWKLTGSAKKDSGSLCSGCRRNVSHWKVWSGVLGIGGVVVTSHVRGVQGAIHLLLVRGQLAAGQYSVI